MRVSFDKRKCIHCMACIFVCGDVFKSRGMHVIVSKKKALEKCSMCKDKLCKKMCPTGAITLLD